MSEFIKYAIAEIDQLIIGDPMSEHSSIGLLREKI